MTEVYEQIFNEIWHLAKTSGFFNTYGTFEREFADRLKAKLGPRAYTKEAVDWVYKELDTRIKLDILGENPE